MQARQGEEAVLSVEFRNAEDQLINVIDPMLNVFDALTGDPVLTAVTPVSEETGVYQYTWDVPLSQPVGWYRSEWTGMSGEVPLLGVEFFEVIAVDDYLVPDEVAHLRKLLSDNGAEPFFSNDELHTLMVKYNGSFNGAAWEGWLQKAAEWAELIPMNTGGSDRGLDKKFDHATKMAKMYEDAWKRDRFDASRRPAPRVAGLTFALGGSESSSVWGPPEDPHQTIFPYGAADYVRPFPLKRFLRPAIMGGPNIP